MVKNILLVDDEVGFRKLLARLLELEDYHITEADNFQQGLTFLNQSINNPYTLVLCDGKLPDGSGFELLKLISEKRILSEFILMTAYGTIPDGVKAIQMGAFDYLTKTDDKDRLLVTIARAVEKAILRQRILQLEKKNLVSFEEIIGGSPALQDVMRLARKVALADTSVFLNGETGTGKELFAQAIHLESQRRGAGFVAINCSAFPAELLESELFGYKKGAFTGANTDKRGLIEEANGGTLFLDEIGEMPLPLQAKLLRVLETQTFIKLGETRETKVNIRVISATHRDLLADENHFRSDLFYRLSVFKITLPALRERIADIPLLTRHFVQLSCSKMGRKLLSVSADFLTALQQYNWKGNIRELKNVIERAVILCDNEELTSDLLPAEVETATRLPGSTESLAYVEQQHILKILEQTNGNKNEAAKRLQIGLATLYRKLQSYGIH